MKQIIPSDFKYFPCPECRNMNNWSGSFKSKTKWNNERAYKCQSGHIYTHKYLIGLLNQGINLNIRRNDKMVDIAKLKEKEKSPIDFDSIPAEFKATLVSDEFDEDENLRLTLEIKNFGQFPQVLKPMHMAKLREQLEKLGYSDTEPLKELHNWKKIEMQIGFGRWLPISKAKQEIVKEKKQSFINSYAK